MLKFKGREIPGTHERVWASAPAVQRSVTKFMGVNGASEIYGGQGTRTIRTRIWLHDADNPYAEADLIDELQRLADLAGEHGKLQVLAPKGMAKTFKHCTFMGFQEDQGMGGRIDGAGVLGYFAPGTLEFEQLLIKK